MSLYYMQNQKDRKIKYTRHGRTKQSFKDACDINKLLEKAAKQGGLSHIEKHGAKYADYAAIDWENLPLQLARGQQVFNELPAELKREFDQNPADFYEYVTDPQNAGRLEELIPAIAERGNFFPLVNKIETRKPENTSTDETGQPGETPRVTPGEPPQGDSTPPGGGET